jgi:Protein of unknown function (DUF3105)
VRLLCCPGPLRSTAVAVGLAVTVLLTGCSAGAEKPTGGGIEGLVVAQSDPSHEHTTAPQTYPRTPPVGGPHWPPQAEGVLGWLRCGVYDTPVPDEFVVHSEEHGAVWLTYRPGAAAADVAALTALAGLRPDYVVVSPYPGQPQPFMASTWGAQLGVASSDDPRLAEVVRRYAGGGQGGEQGADCAGGTLPAAAEAAQRAVTAQ